MKTDPNTQATGAPLPWIFDGDFVVVDCPRGQFPVVCRPLNEADGNLIAAAGDLYELLLEGYNYINTFTPDQLSNWFARAAEAIEKARGESNAD